LLGQLFEKVGPHFFNRLDVPFRAEQSVETKGKMDSQRPETLGGLRVIGRDEIDGVRFHLQGGAWVLVRFSGTEPLLRIYAEASSQDQVDRLLEDARGMVNV
jgi:phosphomannomutase